MTTSHRTQCYLCESQLSDAPSEEHLIPNALGGRITSQQLLCEPCNSVTGHQLDAELAAQLATVCNLLVISRERGTVPDIVVRKRSGEELIRQPNGRLRPRRVTISERRDEDTAFVHIAGGTRREVIKAVRGLGRKYPKLDVDHFLANGMTIRSEATFESFQMEIRGLGGHNSFRAVAKIACNVCLGMSIAELTPNDDGPTYVRGEHSCFDEVGGFYYATDPVVARDTNRALHIVAIRGNPSTGRITSYVELFGAFRYAVMLSHRYSGPSFVKTFALDPITGGKARVEVSGDGDWLPDSELPIEALPRSMVPLIALVEARSHHYQIDQLVRRAFARTLREHGDAARGEHLFPYIWKELEPYILARISAASRRRRGEESKKDLDPG